MSTVRLKLVNNSSAVRLTNTSSTHLVPGVQVTPQGGPGVNLTRSSAGIQLANANFAYVAAPASQPTISTSAISDLSNYSNTQAMLANDATTYANAVSYVDSRGFVTNAEFSANLANYTPTANLRLSVLSDVVPDPFANGATLIFNNATNKYVVKQIDLDGGSF